MRLPKTFVSLHSVSSFALQLIATALQGCHIHRNLGMLRHFVLFIV